jgi:rhamnogalacturonan endolyase
MKKIMTVALTLLFIFHSSLLTTTAQPKYDFKKLHREALDRGVVAIRNGGKVVVSWRTLSSDKVGEAFDVYRDGQKLNEQPLTKGGTCFTDEHPLTTDAF